MSFVRYLGFVFGGAFGVVFSTGSVCMITYSPENPDWFGFFLTLTLGSALLTVAGLCYEAEFGKKESPRK